MYRNSKRRVNADWTYMLINFIWIFIIIQTSELRFLCKYVSTGCAEF